VTLVADAKVNSFVLKSHNKLQRTLIKNKILLEKRKNTEFLPKNMAFWQNHGFRDFCVPVIFCCLLNDISICPIQ